MLQRSPHTEHLWRSPEDFERRPPARRSLARPPAARAAASFRHRLRPCLPPSPLPRKPERQPRPPHCPRLLRQHVLNNQICSLLQRRPSRPGSRSSSCSLCMKSHHISDGISGAQAEPLTPSSVSRASEAWTPLAPVRNAAASASAARAASTLLHGCTACHGIWASSGARAHSSAAHAALAPSEPPSRPSAGAP